MVTRLCTRLLRERDRLTQFSGSPGSIPIIGYGSVPWADFGTGGGVQNNKWMTGLRFLTA